MLGLKAWGGGPLPNFLALFCVTRRSRSDGSESLTHSWSADLTEVTLANEDTYREDEKDELFSHHYEPQTLDGLPSGIYGSINLKLDFGLSLKLPCEARKPKPISFFGLG